jgi:hypothetical protein
MNDSMNECYVNSQIKFELLMLLSDAIICGQVLPKRRPFRYNTLCSPKPTNTERPTPSRYPLHLSFYRPGCCPASPGPSFVHAPLLMPSSILPQILSTTSLSLHLPFSVPVHLSTLTGNTPLPRLSTFSGGSSLLQPTKIPG